MALTKEQAKMIADSWELMKPDVETHGVRLFKHIFEIAPQAKAMFPFLRDYEGKPEDNPKLRRHATHVFKLAGETVSKYGEKEEIEFLQPILESLGARHANYGVQPEHFPIVGEALLRTLDDGFGEKLSPQLRAAWAQAYELVSQTMQKGLAKAHSASAASAPGPAPHLPKKVLPQETLDSSESLPEK